MTQATIEEIREELINDYMKQEYSPQNCLMKDYLLAMINYTEKVEGEFVEDPAKVVARGIDAIIYASVSSLINFTYRINGICTRCNPEAAIKLTEYMKARFIDDLLKQSLEVAVVQVGECNGRERQAHQEGQSADQTTKAGAEGQTVQRPEDTE
jgi:hypothetical protein